MIKKIVLPNGLRIITIPVAGAKTVTVLAMVGTGSHYETKKINGISHFLEHLFFKGTKKRPSTRYIAETLDRIGGEYNAFTSQEYTGFYAKVAGQHLPVALDWISDILLNSKFAEEEVEREKGVIIEEIKLYQDTPVAYIRTLFEKTLYGDQPAGWFIAGTQETIKKIKRNDILKYWQNQYTGKNALLCLAGKIDKEKTLKSIRSAFKNFPKGQPRKKLKIKEKQTKPKIVIEKKKTDQTHLALGVRAFSLFHPDRFALSLLSIILGGNMSSRLFIEVRERRALAYYISTSAEKFTDTGYLVTRAGVDQKKLPLALKTILAEYAKMKKERVSREELQKAKHYLKGSTLIDLETSDGMAFWTAGQEILTRKVLTPEEVFRKIDRVTSKDLQRVANNIFQNKKLNLALIGPQFNQRELNYLLKL